MPGALEEVLALVRRRRVVGHFGRKGGQHAQVQRRIVEVFAHEHTRLVHRACQMRAAVLVCALLALRCAEYAHVALTAHPIRQGMARLTIRHLGHFGVGGTQQRSRPTELG